MATSSCCSASAMSRPWPTRPSRASGRRVSTSRSAAEQRDDHAADVVLAVRVDEDDALPRSEDDTASVRRQHERGRDDDRQEVVAAVADRAVTMRITVISREEPFEEFLEVALGAR